MTDKDMQQLAREAEAPPERAGAAARRDPFILEITDDVIGQRLDRALAAALKGVSRTRAQALIEGGHALVNGRQAKPSLLLEPGMRVTVVRPPRVFGQATVAAALDAPPVVVAFADGLSTPPDTLSDANADPLAPQPVRIIYDDQHILVVEKPAGVVTHPAPGRRSGTLVDALLAYSPQLSALVEQPDADADSEDDTGLGEFTERFARPGIVHRLDKDTSGLLVVAKDAASAAALTTQMRERSMVKRYLALVEGIMAPPEGVIDAPLGRDPRARQRMALLRIAAGGREARTRFRALGQARGRTLLEAQLETGRTHQIRVHFAAVHHPVVADIVYGRAQPPMPPRQFLHAAQLAFTHPITGSRLSFVSPLPPDLRAFLAEHAPELLQHARPTQS